MATEAGSNSGRRSRGMAAESARAAARQAAVNRLQPAAVRSHPVAEQA